MFFLDEGKVAAYLSHDAAAEVFVFFKGECEAKVQGLSERFSPDDVLYVPAEQKHELANIGDGRLEVWLTVTPNITPSHIFTKSWRTAPGIELRRSWTDRNRCRPLARRVSQGSSAMLPVTSSPWAQWDCWGSYVSIVNCSRCAATYWSAVMVGLYLSNASLAVPAPPPSSSIIVVAITFAGAMTARL